MNTIKIFISDDDLEEAQTIMDYLSRSLCSLNIDLSIKISRGFEYVLEEIKEFKPNIIVIEAFYPSQIDGKKIKIITNEVVNSTGYMLNHKNEKALLPKIYKIKNDDQIVIIFSKYRTGPINMVTDALTWDSSFVDKGYPPEGVVYSLRDSCPIKPGNKELLKQIIAFVKK